LLQRRSISRPRGPQKESHAKYAELVDPVKDTFDEMQLSTIETILVVGVIACLLLATWEMDHLAVDA